MIAEIKARQQSPQAAHREIRADVDALVAERACQIAEQEKRPSRVSQHFARHSALCGPRESGADSTPDAKSKPKARRKTSPAAAPVALVDDSSSFDMLPKGGDLWVKNAAKEGALIAEMRKGAKLEIKAASLRGHQSIDTYSLTGFAQAMERLQKECPGK